MSSVEKNRYWIPNLDINKKVITQEIQYYLGPESTVRPYTREVIFLYSLLNNMLTGYQGRRWVSHHNPRRMSHRCKDYSVFHLYFDINADMFIGANR